MLMSPEAATLENTYTDAPNLHPNLILGSLQLLLWLLFHPSAWRNHVARIDPYLRPDFCLTELSWEQWRDPNLRRLLITGCIVLPFLTGSLAGLVRWALGMPAKDVVANVAVGVVLSMAFCIAFGMATSVVCGVVFGAAAGAAISSVGNVTGVMLGDVALGAASSIAIAVAIGVGVGAATGAVGSVISQRPTYSLTRQISGVVIGILIGLLVIAIWAAAVAVVANKLHIAVAGVIEAVADGLILGAAVGWRVRRWRSGVTFGILFSVVIVITNSTVPALATGLEVVTMFGAFFALSYVLAERVAGSWAGAVAGAMGFGGIGIIAALGGSLPSLWVSFSFVSMAILSGLTLTWWLPVALYPLVAVWNLVLLNADERRVGDRPSLLRWHSVFWDEHQRLRLYGLDEYLVLVMERSPAEGQAAAEYLATTSRQRWAAQAAQIELDARGLERCTDAATIADAHRRIAAGELEGPASALLRSFSRISQDVRAALQQESAYNQRLALNAIEDRLDGLLRELTRSSERYAVRFRPIAARWRQTLAGHAQKLAEAVELRQEIDSPYVIGVPLTEQQEIFVGRADVSTRIEQLLLDRRRPPLLLYGQRRMGKTSLLNNLGRLLPSTIVPLFVDLQGPASRASDHVGFLYNIARGMVDSARQQRVSLPRLSREELIVDPFTCFDEWLDKAEGVLRGNTALLALDEFEALEGAIAKGRFDEQAVLGTLRHLIQHRPRFKVLISGSHTLEEVQRWASYLINVQVVHISYLKEDEARQLIECPVDGFALRYQPDACQRVLDLTRCHPFLVQLLCAEVVALKNEQYPAARRLARLPDVEEAAAEALSHGSFFFADIERNQVAEAGLALLRFLAAQGEGAVISREALAHRCSDPEELDRSLILLTRRDLIEPADEGYRFQVELIRRWFAR